MNYDVIIIGAGLGGLECGYTLAKRGLRVCVLEKERVVGGCLQCYRRGQQLFDTGFHYVGGLAEGQPLHRLFDYFGLLDLPWKQLDMDAFDEVVLGNQSYCFAQGYERFAERLSEDFPHQRQQLHRYADFLRQVGDNLVHSLEPRDAEDVYGQSLFARSAYDYLRETITDERLRQVLSGTSLKMELKPDTLPLYTFAQINSSFIQSAWRLQGGGQQLVDLLADHVREQGGEVLTQAEVIGFTEDGERLTGVRVRLKDGEETLLEGRQFISNLHPAATMQLLQDSQLLRRIYRNRISRMENTYGMMTVSLQLKPGTMPYLNRNRFIYREGTDLWLLHSYQPGRPTPAVMVSYRYDGCETTENIDLLAPIYWEEVQQWEATRALHRGTDYEAFKQKKAQEMIDLVQEKVFGTKNAIERMWTSTSLTYRDYTAATQGTAYGVRKDYNNLLYTLLTPNTPAPNLFLTGQSLNLHGVLGTTMTSFFTCSALLGERVNPFGEL